MKAKITLKVEVLDGPDAGYTIEEQDRCDVCGAILKKEGEENGTDL